MSMLQKRLLIVGGIVILIAFITIFLITTKRSSEMNPLSSQENNEVLPITTEAPREDEVITNKQSDTALRKISEGPVFDFWISHDGSGIYYLGKDGRVFSGKNGPDPEILGEKIPVLNRIEPSPSSTKLLAAFGDPYAPQWAIFSASDKFWSPLPGGIIETTWGREEDQLFVFRNDNTISEIDLSKSPFIEKVLIKNVNFRDIRLVYHPDNKLLLVEKSSGIYEGRIFQFDLKTLNLNLLFSAQKGSMLSFSEDRSWVFKYSSQNGVSILTKTFSSLIPKEAGSDAASSFSTLNSKCNSWRENVFCFVPAKISQGGIMPDNYFSEKFYSVDTLYKIDSKTGLDLGVMTAGEEPLGFVDAKNVRVRGNKVYFINRYDDALYELTLSNN